MTEGISQFFVNTFGGNVWLATFLISLIPLVELKGAIPFAMSTQFWGEKALSSGLAFLFAFFGSSLVVPIVALVFKPICNWLCKYKFFRAIINFFTGSVKKKSETVNAEVDKKTERRKTLIKMLEVFLFVAFPVPLTGVWTGTCFAVLLGLNFWQTCLSAILGNAVCGLIVTLVCVIFPGATTIILYVFLGVIAVAFLTKLVMHFVKKSKLQKEEKLESDKNIVEQ